jgi:hypothetical protein
MTVKFLVPLGLIAAFILGSIVSEPTTKAFNVPQNDTPAVLTPASAPVRAAAVAPRPTAVRRVAATSPAPVVAEKKKRSWQKEALIIGGSAGAGAAIGAIAGGKKGAAIGGVSGGVAGAIYDIATRNK